MISRAGAAVLAVASLLACAPADAGDEACPATRRGADGSCCAAWTEASGEQCVLRPWTTPAVGDAIGEAGAIDPEVALDAGGRIVATWTAVHDTRTRIAIAEVEHDGRATIHEPGVNLAGDGVAPSIAADARGRVLVAWRQQQGSDGAIHYSERDADGAWQWPRLQTQLSYGPTAYEPRPVYAPSGETLVVYNQWTGEHFGAAVARRGSDRLDGPLMPIAGVLDVLSPLVLYANAPRLAVAGNGDAIVTWYQSPGGPLMTFVSERFREHGAFSRPTADAFVSAPGAPVDSHPESNPMPAIHDRGAAAIAWTQDNGAGHVPVYLATRDSLGRWTTPADLGDSFSTPAGVARCAQVAFGGDGSLWITWYEGSAPEGLRVLAAHRRADGTWAEPGRDAALLSTPGRPAIEPALAVGPEGEAVVAWVERAGDRWVVAARRRNPGADVWLAVEVLSGAIDEDASEPAVAMRDGRVVVAWISGRIGTGRVRVATVDLDAP